MTTRVAAYVKPLGAGQRESDGRRSEIPAMRPAAFVHVPARRPRIGMRVEY